MAQGDVDGAKQSARERDTTFVLKPTHVHNMLEMFCILLHLPLTAVWLSPKAKWVRNNKDL